MKLDDEITEAPQIIGDVDWDLAQASVNRAKALSFVKSSDTEFLETYDDALNLYRNKGQYFACPINEQDKIVYWIKTNVKYQSMIQENTVTQISLWRDMFDLHAVDLPSHVFFNYLLPEHHVIMADSQQTQAGRRFWLLRVRAAFDKGFHVYYAKVVSPRKVVKILDVDEFNKLSREIPIWGDTIQFQDKKVIISDHPLTPKSDVDFDG